MLVCVAALAVLAPPLRGSTGYQKRPTWMPKIAWSVGECETGLDVHHYSSGQNGTYVSAFGFRANVWEWFRHPDGRADPDRLTYPADATRASLWQQWRVTARKVRHFNGWSGWGCYDHGGYLTWMGRA